MASDHEIRTGEIVWFDLTVPDGEAIRDFYSAVVGWKSSPVDVGGYNDFNMLPQDGDSPVAGICHARGMIADLPPQWLAYVSVRNLDESLERCRERGGSIVAGPMGDPEQGRYCVIRDPAGAVLALLETG